MELLLLFGILIGTIFAWTILAQPHIKRADVAIKLSGYFVLITLAMVIIMLATPISILGYLFYQTCMLIGIDIWEIIGIVISILKMVCPKLFTAFMNNNTNYEEPIEEQPFND